MTPTPKMRKVCEDCAVSHFCQSDGCLETRWGCGLQAEKASNAMSSCYKKRSRAKTMNGSFNGIPLNRITSIRVITTVLGDVQTTFRILGGPFPQLEKILELNAPATLNRSDREIRGKIIHYSADLHAGYEITIETARSIPLHRTASR